MKDNILVAKSAGFCFGVKRAVDMVYQEAKTDNHVYTWGPIIHNDEVVNDLREKGVNVLSNLNDLKRIVNEQEKVTLIIRSHGISKKLQDEINQLGIRVIDATCPFVKKIHSIVEKSSSEEKEIIIIGNKNHPEVEGIKGWCGTQVTVIETADEAQKFVSEMGKTIVVVAQTTYNYKKFQELVEIISKKGYDIIAVNTICNATEERQREASDLSKNVDVMIVVGGQHSSNSQKLYDICKNECIDTFFIQTVDDLQDDIILEKLKSFHSLGITAGASTPNNIIQEVLQACQREVLKKCWTKH